jgi:hypothetical protein
MIIGHYQGIPIGGRIAEVRDDVVIIEIYPILPNPGDGEPIPVAA